MNQNTQKMPLANKIALFIIVLMPVMGIVIFCKFFVPDFLRRHQQENLRNGDGQIATARIISIGDTGRRYASSPVVHFALEVTGPDSKKFNIAIDQEISILLLPRFQPGAEVKVKYSLEKPELAVIQ